ncbi:alcohol acyl transferase [Scheffersomyces xylosifermentans]|uniref:alcohol acyl transferase n=1 Tax=Scheffersomyces xylosifermentans TaxID=1304137 RepID=UPI00315D5CBC
MGILNWGFRTNVKLHQAQGKDSLTLPLKNSPGETVQFSDFIKNEVKIIDTSKKLWLNPLLFNGVLQTLYYTSVDTTKKFLIYYGRELFTYKDKGICSLDWVIPKPESKEEFKKLHDQTFPEGFPKLHPRTRYMTEEELAARRAHNQDTDSTKPIVVILHGLSGGSHEPLIRNLADSINKNTEGWDTVVLNNRGCCRTLITSPKLFNALSTEDIREVLVDLKERYPSRPIYAVGFSFGACILANFLGDPNQDEKTRSLVKAACLIGCPWDLVDSSHHLDNSYSGIYLFNPALTTFLQKMVKNNYAALRSFDPELFTDELYRKFMAPKTTWQFDDVFTCSTAGFSDAYTYYREASPARRIGSIKTPTLILNSNDDPAVSVRLPWLEVSRNPALALVETDLGGHLSYAQSSGEFWSVLVVEEYFKSFSETIA